MAITYKTVISNAIADFNSIQNALAVKSTDIATTADSSKESTILATNILPGKIRDYLVFPSGNLAITGAGTHKVATDVASGTNRTGYATVSVASAGALTLSLTDRTTGDVTVGSESAGYYPLTATLSGDIETASAGWFTTGKKSVTDANVVVGRLAKATFKVSNGNNIVVNTAGYIPANATVGTVSGGEATIQSISSLATTLGSGTNDVGNTLFSTDTSTGTFYKLVFNETVSKKSFTAGYITDVTIEDALATTKYIKQSELSKGNASTSTTAAETITPAQEATISAGYYPNSRIIKVNSSATATAATILKDATAWVNGSKITGTMPNNAAISATANPKLGTDNATVSYSYTVPAGYHNGSGKVSGSLNLGSSVLTASAPSFTVFEGTSQSALTTNIFSSSAPTSGGYYKVSVKSNASTTTGYEVADTKASTAVNYFLPKASFEYLRDNPDMIACKSAGYVSAGDIVVGSGSIDYAEITGTLSSSIKNKSTDTDVTDVSSSIFLASAPTDLTTAYKIYSSHTITSPGYVNSDSIVDTPRYIKKGVEPATKNLGYGASATIPSGFYADSFTIKNNIGAGTIDVVDNTVNITSVTVGAKSGTSYPITGTGTVTVSSSVTTAGYVSSSVGTKNTGTVTGKVNATIAAGSVSAGAASQVANTKAPTAAGGNAITTTSDKTHVYVSLNRPAVTATEGYITSANSLASNTSGKAYIPAVLSPEISTTSVNGSGSVGSATTFTESTGAIATAGSKSGSISVSGSTTDTANKDKYIITSIVVKGSGTATANIAADATGTTVDSYVESLYKRMLGKSYVEVDED